MISSSVTPTFKFTLIMTSTEYLILMRFIELFALASYFMRNRDWGERNIRHTASPICINVANRPQKNAANWPQNRMWQIYHKIERGKLITKYNVANLPQNRMRQISHKIEWGKLTTK
jgi:hypothetical protein